jgi:hypothetical protein
MMNQEHTIYGARVVKHAVDAVAVAGIPAAILDSPHLPGIYTMLGIVWIAFRIYELRSIQRIVAAIRNWLSA